MALAQFTYAAADSECSSNSVYSYFIYQPGNTTRITCNDMLGRVVQTITAGFTYGDDLYQTTTYDKLGRVKKVSEPYSQSDLNGGVTLYYTQYKSYDVLNRVKEKLDAKSVDALYTYGVNGNPLDTQIAVTPPDSPAYTSYETHDSLGKLISTLDANGSETDFRYDAGGNPVLIQDAAGNQTLASFNILGQKTAITDPDMGSWTYAYDVLGELLQQTDAKGQQIAMAYDKLGRMTSKLQPESATPTIWTYDSCTHGIGKLCNVTQFDGYSETDGYDQDGRLSSSDEKISGTDYVTTTTYDNVGRVSTISYPATIADAAPVISSVTASQTTVLMNSAPVTLMGTATDSDTTTTTAMQYQWTVTSTTCGCTAVLSSTTTPVTQFTPAMPGIYTFQFLASDGLQSATSTITVNVQPQAPGALNINMSANYLGVFGVNWSAATGAAAYNPTYNLYQSTDGTHFTKVMCPAYCGGVTASFTGMGSQSSNITYTYKATAVANGVEGPADNTASTTIYYPPTEPAPHALPAQSTGYRTFVVSWTASAGVNPSYTAKAGIPGGDVPTFYNKGSCNTTGTSCTITVAADDVYVVEVYSCNQSACNAPVVAPGEVTVWHFTPPAAPTGLDLTFGTGNNVTVSWTAPSAQPGAIMTYELFNAFSTKTGPLSAWNQIYSGSATSFATTIPLTRYDSRYYVVACNQAGCGGSSTVLIYINDQTGGGGGCVGCQPKITIKPPVSGPRAAPAAASSENTAVPVSPPPAGGRTASITGPSTSGLFAAQPVSPVKITRAPTVARMASTRTFDYAPPVYKAYAGAHLQAVTSTRSMVGVTVLYHYNLDGYLNKIVNDANPNQVFWKATGMNARDQVTDEQYGLNGAAIAVTSHRDYYPESGYAQNIQSNNASAAALQNLHYDWQELGNLADRQDLRQNVGEAFQYDILNRLTSAQVTNGGGIQPAVTYGYDALGNLTCKSDVTNTTCAPSSGGYVYGGQPNAGPHAVTSVPGVSSYSYEPNGNMNNRNGTTLGWSSDNMPISIVQDASDQSAFNYAPDKHRYYQTAKMGGLIETTVYAGDLEIVSDTNGTHNRYQLSAYGKSVAIIDLETDSNTNPVVNDQYVLTDNLGSMDVVTDANGTVIASTGFSFGAFGNRRDSATLLAPTNSTQVSEDRAVTHRGFTGHEMLDNVGLVHANGRVYDPVLGRFLSVDPVFQFPTNTQSLNPYSYVLNNPLSATDPSGYSENCTAGQTTGCSKGYGQEKSSESSRIASGKRDSSSIKMDTLGRSAGIVFDNKTTVLGGTIENGKEFGSNGEENAQQGAGSMLATGKSQAAGTAPSTATQAASESNSAGLLSAAPIESLLTNGLGSIYSDPHALDVSDAQISDTEKSEGFSLFPKPDPSGSTIDSVGHGYHLNSIAKISLYIKTSGDSQILSKFGGDYLTRNFEKNYVEGYIERSVHVSVTQGQFDAMSDYVYQHGHLGSLFLFMINQKNYTGAAYGLYDPNFKSRTGNDVQKFMNSTPNRYQTDGGL